MDRTQRLDKYLSGMGICSRRNVEQFLKGQNLSINGRRVIEPGTRLNIKTATVTLNGVLFKKPKLVYYMLNKPAEVISTVSDEFGRKNVVSLVPSKQRIFPVGRLDKDTTGLIILTNDGELTNLLTHPRHEVHKTYILVAGGRVNERQLERLQTGVELEDGLTAPAGVRVLRQEGKTTVIQMSIHEGKNRQIRRMCESVKIHLIALERVKFGPIFLGDLKEGRCRELTDKEVSLLRKAGKSSPASSH